MYYKRRYTMCSFIFDCFMTVLTCGFWLIRIYVRENRYRR